MIGSIDSSSSSQICRSRPWNETGKDKRLHRRPGCAAERPTHIFESQQRIGPFSIHKTSPQASRSMLGNSHGFNYHRHQLASPNNTKDSFFVLRNNDSIACDRSFFPQQSSVTLSTNPFASLFPTAAIPHIMADVHHDNQICSISGAVTQHLASNYYSYRYSEDERRNNRRLVCARHTGR